MQTITISGLDGSGKSTQIEMLKTYLGGQGKKVFYFHAVEFSLANKLSGKSGDGNSKSVTEANFLQIMLRRFFLMIDILRFKLLRSKLRSTGVDYIVSDRYFYDSVVNIAYLKSQRGDTRYKIQDTRYKKIIRPDFAFYLSIDPQSIMQRNRVPDQGLEYLQKKKELYDKAAAVWGLKIIDGNRSKEEIFEEIIKLI